MLRGQPFRGDSAQWLAFCTARLCQSVLACCLYDLLYGEASGGVVPAVEVTSKCVASYNLGLADPIGAAHAEDVLGVIAPKRQKAVILR